MMNFGTNTLPAKIPTWSVKNILNRTQESPPPKLSSRLPIGHVFTVDVDTLSNLTSKI